MTGKTNAMASGAIIEKLNITLKTNQSIHTDLNGAIITVTYADQTITHVWDGKVVVIEVPAYVSYTVAVSAVTGYYTPSSYRGTSVPDNSLPLTFTYNLITLIDLSKQDIYGNTINQTTANCYVVSTVGTYAFPLVYGNAIANGVVNNPAFTKINGTYVMNFVNHLNNTITSPFIEDHGGCAAGSAELSMADTDGVFSGLEIIEEEKCRYIKFMVNTVPATGANGVISVLGTDGVVMWSWHIWVWPDDLTPVTITNSTGVNYNILPVNLATKKSTTAGKMYNWFYQWGRPTPMLPSSDYNSGTDAANYGVRDFVITTTAGTYGAGIQNPNMFYKGLSTPYNWFSGYYYNLWDANCSSTGRSDNTVIKTVYDPCPVGFKMPNGATFSFFSSSNVLGSFDGGWTFKCNKDDTTGVFFPASGERHRQSGVVMNSDINGTIWLSSSANDKINAGEMSFNKNSVYHSDDYRASGNSVRPVQE